MKIIKNTNTNVCEGDGAIHITDFNEYIFMQKIKLTIIISLVVLLCLFMFVYI